MTSSPPLYGQVVVGPPGCGKTTYCNGMQQYLKLLGRDAQVINLDPANESPTTPSSNTDTGEGSVGLPYETIFDVCQEAVNLSSVMKQLELGPNGGLVYCMSYIEEHAESIIDLIAERVSDSTYLLLDLPGQVELYTHGTAVSNLLQQLSKRLDLRLCMVQLIDAHYCTDATKFLSATVLSTSTMLRLQLPAVNVLSKIDLLSQYGELPLSLDFFTECHDLHLLLDFLNVQPMPQDGEPEYADDPDYQKARAKTRNSVLVQKHKKLYEALVEVVDDFGLLQFVGLNISDAESVGRVVARIDKCNGYVFRGSTKNPSQDLFQCAIQQDDPQTYDMYVQERFPETIPELNPPEKSSSFTS